MADYDPNNNGAAFPPFDDMKMILQGKINVEGRDGKYVIVRRESRDGKEIMEVYEKVGAMFPSDNTRNQHLTTQVRSTKLMTNKCHTHSQQQIVVWLHGAE